MTWPSMTWERRHRRQQQRRGAALVGLLIVVIVLFLMPAGLARLGTLAAARPPTGYTH
jgi:Tfp pilus assembly protein PilX